MIQLKIDDSQLKRLSDKLEKFPKEIPKAANAAMNRTITYVKKEVKKSVTAEYNVKSGEIEGTLSIKKSSGNIGAMIISRGKTLNMDHFPSNIESGLKKRKAIKVKIKKSGFKNVSTQPKAFIASLGGTFHIAKRKGNARFPIKVLSTLSIPQMISNSKISENVQQKAQEQLKKRIDHEIEYRLNKMSGR